MVLAGRLGAGVRGEEEGEAGEGEGGDEYGGGTAGAVPVGVREVGDAEGYCES